MNAAQQRRWLGEIYEEFASIEQTKLEFIEESLKLLEELEEDEQWDEL